MAEIELPSGRVVPVLKERFNYGDVCDAQDASAVSRKLNDYYLSLESVLTGLSVAELRELDPEDGKALESEVLRRAGKKEVAQQVPFETESSSPSTDTILTSPSSAGG